MKNLLVLSLALCSSLAQAASPTAATKISNSLTAKLEGGMNADVLVRFKDHADLSYAPMIQQREDRLRYVYEALKATALASQAKAIALLEAEKAAYRPFYLENAIHIPNASKELLEKLASLSQTDLIVPNAKMKLPALPAQSAIAGFGDPRGEPADNIKSVGADKVWAEGHKGEGIVIAGNDTGFDWQHPALKRQYRGNTALGVTHAYEWHDSVHATGSRCGADSAAPCDDDMHGTHTMGTMLGDDGANNRIGVAPESKWIGCRNMNAGAGTAATYLECFQFFLAPYPMGGSPMNDARPELAPHIINNSWGCPPEEGCQGNEFLETVRALKAAGILVVAAVGNDGPGCGTIGMPPGGYSGEVLGVAAMNHRNGSIAGFSSRGPSSWNNGIGVDIAAPGVNIRSSVPGGSYSSASGTSMASPHMAGIAALLWSARPELIGKIDETIALLKRTAKPTTTTQNCGSFNGSQVPNAVFGAGIVDVYAATKGTL